MISILMQNSICLNKLQLKNGKIIDIPVRKDGYINVTKLCEAAGKRIDNWKANKDSKELLHAFNKLPEMSGSLSLEIIEGRNGGTYAHPDIAIAIAMWCDKYFHLQVCRWIRELLLTGKVELDKEKSNEELEKIYKEKYEKLLFENNEKYELALIEKDGLEKELEELQEELDISKNRLEEDKENIIKMSKKIKAVQSKFRYRHKFAVNNCIYVLKNPTEKFEKYKFGKTNDINRRLKQYNTSIPNIEVCFIIYTEFYNELELSIKNKCIELNILESPQHEWIFCSFDKIVNIIKDINNACGYGGVMEKELWRYNLHKRYDNIEEIMENKIITEFIIEDNSEDELTKRENNFLNFVENAENIPSNIDIDMISYYDILPTRLLRCDYDKKNKEAPESQRWCNGFCQQYKLKTEFNYKSAYLHTICHICIDMIECAKIKIKNKEITLQEIHDDPRNILLKNNEKICKSCNKILDKSNFIEKRNQCKKCRNKKRSNRTINININNEIEKIKNYNINELKNKLEKYTRDELRKLISHLKIGLKSTDLKNDMIRNLYNYFDKN